MGEALLKYTHTHHSQSLLVGQKSLSLPGVGIEFLNNYSTFTSPFFLRAIKTHSSIYLLTVDFNLLSLVVNFMLCYLITVSYHKYTLI